MNQLFRFGKISKVYYEDGLVDVVYKDRTDAVSEGVRLLLHEYGMPDVDDPVFVLHMPNGRTEALCFGRYWFEGWKPTEGFKGLYRKCFSRKQDGCYFRYTDPDENDGANNNGEENDGKATFHNEDDARAEAKNFEREAREKITDKSKGHKIDVDGDAEIMATGKATVKAQNIEIDGTANITIKAGAQLNLSGQGGTVDLTGTIRMTGTGDIVLSGKSHINHTHSWEGGNAGGPVGGVTGPPI
jgi:hypothetical protein